MAKTPASKPKTPFHELQIRKLDKILGKHNHLNLVEDTTVKVLAKVLEEYELTGPALSASLKQIREIASRSLLAKTLLANLIATLEDRAR